MRPPATSAPMTRQPRYMAWISRRRVRQLSGITTSQRSSLKSRIDGLTTPWLWRSAIDCLEGALPAAGELFHVWSVIKSDKGIRDPGTLEKPESGSRK